MKILLSFILGFIFFVMSWLFCTMIVQNYCNNQAIGIIMACGVFSYIFSDIIASFVLTNLLGSITLPLKNN